MAPVKTEDLPYTEQYVRELLKVDDATLTTYVDALTLSPKVDDQTRAQVFTHREVELLRRALEMANQGQTLETITHKLAKREEAPLTEEAASHATSLVGNPRYMSVPQQANGSSSLTNRENLAVMVETISQAKENILKDLSKLLDDKLAGLDEVVVELIRCKSENDSLRQKLKAAIEEKEAVEFELSRFKLVQFGFFRKV